MGTRVAVIVGLFALLDVALPEPMMLDLLGVGLTWLGFDLVVGSHLGL